MDLCKLSAMPSIFKNFQKLSYESLKKSMPGIFRRCPYHGRLQYSDVTPMLEALRVFPLGRFKSSINIYDDIDDAIFVINSTFKIYE